MIISGSRADYGLLEPVAERLGLPIQKCWGYSFTEAFNFAQTMMEDCLLILGDRYETLAAATAAHLARVPIIHIAGGDVTEGSYDDAMRDCISRMASIHFVTSTSAMARLTHMGLTNIHLVGNPGIDVIRKGDWKAERPYAWPYVVISYQSETRDPQEDGINFLRCIEASNGKHRVFIQPNPDRGSDKIREMIANYEGNAEATVLEFLPHKPFLNLLHHADEFIGNSSAMLYEAPELGVRTRMIGKRQRGRTIPMGDGLAAERIAKILRYAA